MQTNDRMRILRGAGLAVGALLLVSGAVFASQAGLPSGNDRVDNDAGASQEASAAPSADELTVNDLFDQVRMEASGEDDDAAEEASRSAEASPEESPEGREVEHESEHASALESASASPEASESEDEDHESEREHATSSPEATASPDDEGHGDDDGGHHDD
jgi:hypothetical protein